MTDHADADDVLSETDRDLLSTIEALLSSHHYSRAAALAHKRLDAGDIDVSRRSGAILSARLAGILIDVSSAIFTREDAARGVRILEQIRGAIGRFVAEASYEYNLANAKHSLFDIDRQSRDFEYSPDTITLLVQAKDHYWRAFKLLEAEGSGQQSELLVNLGTVLSESGRVAEAIRLYDKVLEQDPGFPQANGCRAEDLLWLNRLSGKYSPMLLMQAHQGFAASLSSQALAPVYRERQAASLARVRDSLGAHGITDVDAALAQHAAREAPWSPQSFERYALDQRLFLSEHGIYCRCPAACTDDVDFDVEGLDSALAVRIRLVLNRAKSEFVLARWKYWHAMESHRLHSDPAAWPLRVRSAVPNEESGLPAELMRSAFRTSYGILDKIATAICDLFALAPPSEHIYFEKLWSLQGEKRGRRARFRWPKLESMAQFPLIGLFSLATDLDRPRGEWAHFKTWRNALEHRGLVVLTEEPSAALRSELEPRFTVVGWLDLREQCLRLLQITAAAIINFVFCVRSHAEWKRRR